MAGNLEDEIVRLRQENARLRATGATDNQSSAIRNIIQSRNVIAPIEEDDEDEESSKELLINGPS